VAHKNKVMRSINTPDGGRCVDVFLRPGGTFGFEEFRRDVEDPSGWFAIGGHIAKSFETEDAAFEQALAAISWIKDQSKS